MEEGKLLAKQRFQYAVGCLADNIYNIEYTLTFTDEGKDMNEEIEFTSTIEVGTKDGQTFISSGHKNLTCDNVYNLIDDNFLIVQSPQGISGFIIPKCNINYITIYKDK